MSWFSGPADLRQFRMRPCHVASRAEPRAPGSRERSRRQRVAKATLVAAPVALDRIAAAHAALHGALAARLLTGRWPPGFPWSAREAVLLLRSDPAPALAEDPRDQQHDDRANDRPDDARWVELGDRQCVKEDQVLEEAPDEGPDHT